MRPLAVTAVRILDPARNLDAPGAIIVQEGKISAAGPDALNNGTPEGALIIDGRGMIAAPGLVDMRVFTGEPGFEHRETLASAARAAAAGGVTSLAVMPDTDPVIDSPALIASIKARAQDMAYVRVHPMAALTKGQAGSEIAEIGLLRAAGAIAFTSGRSTVQNAEVIRRALVYARDFDALVCHLPQDSNLKGAGVMNAGQMATRLGLPGIPAEAETIMLARDLALARMTGARYHAAAVSTAEAVDLLGRAKEQETKISAAVPMTHLTLNEFDIGAYRSFFKMTPPLRQEDDRRALLRGLAMGTIDIIVSNHDPQDVEMKRQPFAEAADGAIGLETLLAAGLRLVHAEEITLMALLAALTVRPARLLGLEVGTLSPGAPADFILIDYDQPWVLSREDILSRSQNTPYENERFTGRVQLTVVGGCIVFSRIPSFHQETPLF